MTPETTYLGAHVVPAEFADRRDDVRRPRRRARCSHACAPYARWADVFCEPGPHAFDGDEARTILTAAAAAGLSCGCTATS